MFRNNLFANGKLRNLSTIAIILSFMFFLSVFLPSEAGVIALELSADNSSYSLIAERVDELQQPALEANRIIYEYFNTEYPDSDDLESEKSNALKRMNSSSWVNPQFGGVRISDFKLDISILDDSIKATILEILPSDLHQYVTFSYVQNSYSQLEDTLLLELLDKPNHLGYINIEENSLTVLAQMDTGKEPKQNVLDYVPVSKDVDVEYSSISISSEEDVRLATPEEIAGREISPMAVTTQLWGGDAVQRFYVINGQLYVSTSTISVAGKWDGVNSILASGHGLTSSGDIYYIDTNGNPSSRFVIGSTRYAHTESIASSGDYAILRVNQGVPVNKILTSKSPITSISMVGSIKNNSTPIGTLIWRYGQNTGKASINKIEARLVTMYNGARSVLTATSLAPGYGGVLSKDGDSGGPYWVNYDGSYYLGVHFGKGALANENWMLYTPFSLINSNSNGNFVLNTN